MKRTIEFPEDLDKRILKLQEDWEQRSYAEVVRVLLVLGLDALDRRDRT